MIVCSTDLLLVPSNRVREFSENLPSAEGRGLRRLGAAPLALLCGAGALCGTDWGPGACGQVITVNSKTGAVTNGSTPVAAPVDRRFQQVTPTNVELPKSILDEKSRLDLIRTLDSEQGFAMRPFPKGHKGLTLEANGKLEPAGEAYLDMVTSEGLSAKPGDRLVLTDVKIEHSKIEFQINGGPDFKHRFLRHIQIGGMGR